jgi:hypothetical protein
MEFNNRRFAFYTICLILAFCHEACNKKEQIRNQVLSEAQQKCRDNLSITYEEGKNLSVVSAYGLESDWEYSGNEIKTLYSESFFSLFEVESTFTKKANKDLRTIITSKESCSGVPPHYLLMERTQYLLNKKDGTIKTVREEVLDGGKLVQAPLEEDEFWDLLYSSLVDDRQFEQYVLRKRLLTPQKHAEFKKILEESSQANLGQNIINKGIFTAQEWERIRKQYYEEKQKGKLTLEDLNVLRK